jgi:hypothetical protein
VVLLVGACSDTGGGHQAGSASPEVSGEGEVNDGFGGAVDLLDVNWVLLTVE